MPTAGCAAAKSSMVVTASAASSVSGLRKSTKRPRLMASPWLLARVKPALSAFAINRTQGNSPANIALLPSVDALSTTITSAVQRLAGCETPAKNKSSLPAMDARQRRNRSRTFQLTMTTETSGAAGSDSATRRRLGRRPAAASP